MGVRLAKCFLAVAAILFSAGCNSRTPLAESEDSKVTESTQSNNQFDKKGTEITEDRGFHGTDDYLGSLQNHLQGGPSYGGGSGGGSGGSSYSSPSSSYSRFSAVLRGLIYAVRAIFLRLLHDEHRIGSVVVRYGTSQLPDTADQLHLEAIYSGFGYGPYYGHGNRENECVKGEGSGATTSGNYGDVIYPLITGGAVHMPPGMPQNRIVPCVTFFVPSTVTTVHGSDSCPTNWTRVFGGYELAGHYSHGGRGTNPVCIDPNTFENSPSYAGPGHYSYIYGTHLQEGTSQLSGTHPNMVYLKCAVCARI